MKVPSEGDGGGGGKERGERAVRGGSGPCLEPIRMVYSGIAPEGHGGERKYGLLWTQSQDECHYC